MAGILFPTALAYMVWGSSGARAMHPATGLLCLAMAAVLLGEVLVFVAVAPT